MCALYRLAFTAGLRRGELLGLHWTDIEFLPDGKAVVQVRRNAVQPDSKVLVQEPKTAASKRRVPVDGGTAQALKGHRQRQLEERQ